MPVYKAPTRDTRFVVNELIGLENFQKICQVLPMPVRI